MYREFNGFYYTAQLKNTQNGEIKAIFEANFNTDLLRNPSNWVVVLERAEINLNSVPFWKFSPTYARPPVNAGDPVNYRDLMEIAITDDAGTTSRYYLRAPPYETPIYSLNDLILHINSQLFILPTEELILFMVDEQYRIHILTYFYYKDTIASFTFYGGLHFLLGCSQTITFGGGSNDYRRFNAYLCDLVSANLNYYMYDLRVNAHIRYLTFLGQATQQNEVCVPDYNWPGTETNFDSTPIVGQTRLGLSGRIVNDGLPVAWNEAVTTADFQILRDAGYVAVGGPTENIGHPAIVSAVNIHAKQMICNLINKNWDAYLDSYVHQVASSFFEYVSPPRADAADLLQHIYFRVLGMTLNSEKFDFGIQEVLADIGGLQGSFTANTRANVLGFNPRQKIVFNPVQKRVCQMNGVAPIRWIRIEALYRDADNNFENVTLSPGDIFDLKLGFYHR